MRTNHGFAEDRGWKGMETRLYNRSPRYSHFVLTRITLLTFESEIVSREQLVKKFDCAETRRSRNQIRARRPPFSIPLNS